MHSVMIEHQIRNFIEENYLFFQPQSLKDSDSFLESGILDSTGILQLVAFLGEAYGIQVADEDLTPNNLDSIDAAAAYVRRKLNASSIEQPTSTVEVDSRVTT